MAMGIGRKGGWESWPRNHSGFIAAHNQQWDKIDHDFHEHDFVLERKNLHCIYFDVGLPVGGRCIY